MKSRIISIAIILAILLGTLTVHIDKTYASPSHHEVYICEYTTWIAYTSVAQLYNGYYQGNYYSVYLQAEIAILVDLTQHQYYCGDVKAQAHDTLNVGCSNFSGDAEIGVDLQAGSIWGPYYHCTVAKYDYTGPDWYPSCYPDGVLSADTTDSNGDTVVSPSWTMTCG